MKLGNQAVDDRARRAGGGEDRTVRGMVDAALARPLPPERCARCHAEHAAVDNVFVQFYPQLRGR